MNIIVTGGAGFIGSNFIFHMLDKYPVYRIICLDCLTYAGNLSTLEPVMDNPNFRFVKESITDREAVYKLFEEEKPYLDENITVGQIAKKLYTNKAYLSRAINDYTGKNFCQFVNYHRIMYSMEIFKENPGYRVSELAEASGFHTIVSFNMAFRLVTNESPGEWCKRTRCGMEPKARRAE